MVPLTRLLTRQVYDVFRRGLGPLSRSVPLAVSFETSAEGFVIQARNSDCALAHRSSGEFSYDYFTVPLEALKACAGPSPDPVSIEPAGDTQLTLRWTDRGIPQVHQFEMPVPADFPSMPTELQDISTRILSALHIAADTTEKDTYRFALNCIRLRGTKGQVEATDSRQLYIESGFEFPWEEDLLVAASPVFRSPLLPTDETVQIGRSEEWVTLVVGPWSIHLAIDSSGRRFPDVEGCIPADSSNATRLQLSEADARFLTESISRLPSDDTQDFPVTVDLNGAVAVRSRGADSEIPTELILSSSVRDGEQYAAAMNRRFLKRALQLGFREIRFQPGTATVPAPAVCSDEQRRYVWGLLDAESIIKPSENAMRIDSADAAMSSNACRHNHQHRNIPQTTGADMTTETTSTNGHARNNGQKTRRPTHLKKPEELTAIDQAVILQDKLRQGVQQTRVLLAALRKERKQTRLMKQTLATLRQLQETG